MPAPKGGNGGSFKEGNSGRPPNELTLKGQLKIKLAQLRFKSGNYGEQVLGFELLADQLLDSHQLAYSNRDFKGQLEYFKEIRDTVEGKPQQSLDVTTAGDPLPIVIFKPEKLADPDNASTEDVEA